MSRIGKTPIYLSTKVHVDLQDNKIKIKGPKGELIYILSPEIRVEHVKETIKLYKNNESQAAKQLYGLHRTIINNMVIGVSQGFSKKLKIQGVGYRAQVNENNLILNVGYSHPVYIKLPPEINIKVENNTNIEILGINKETVGQIAAQIRSVRPPEPYKGKGIRYNDELIRKKVGKAGK